MIVLTGFVQIFESKIKAFLFFKQKFLSRLKFIKKGDQ